MAKTTFIGIDVSKRILDLHILSTKQSFSFENSASGIKALRKKIRRFKKPFCIMEASGGYEFLPHDLLSKHGVPVAVVNPRQVRDFAKAKGILAKTDRIDARVIAEFGQAISPRITPRKSEKHRQLLAAVERRRALVQLKTAESNRKKQARCPEVIENITKMLAFIKEQIKQQDARIAKFLEEDEFREKAEILESFKGLGPVSVAVLIAELPELGEASGKEIGALVGVAPFNVDSGNYKGRRRIRGGRSKLRQTLYMASLVASRYNPVLKEFYDRLREREKSHRQSLIAVQRKMLVILNAMMKGGERWSEEKHHSTT